MKNITLLSLILLPLFAISQAITSGHLVVSRVTAPYLLSDNNSNTPIQHVYVGVKIKNVSSSVTYQGLLFSISSISSSVAGQSFLLEAPSNGVEPIGTLAPGESKTIYLYINYPVGVTATATYNYTITASSHTGSKSSSFTTIARTAISANAGGLSSMTTVNQDQLGSLIQCDITYTLGNVANNDECDLQPTISPLFNPLKFKLISTEVITSSVPGITTGVKDSLYFRTGNGTSSSALTIRYLFRIVAANTSLYILPVAGSTSGSSNYKFAINSDFGANGTPITVSSSANTLTVTKTFDKLIYRCGETAVIVINISNSGSYPISISKLTDELPSGFSFVGISSGSGINVSNSTFYPASSANGTLTFLGGVDSSGITSYLVPAKSGGVNGKLLLIYTALAPGTLGSSDCNANVGTFNTIARVYIEASEIVNSTASATLPVLWNSVFLEKYLNLVKVNWSTASEQNTKDFEIQYSTNATNWSAIGTVLAAGNSTSQRSYSFTHTSPLKNNNYNYYRILQRDLDGKFNYSKIVSILFNEPGPDVVVYPNPVEEVLTIYTSTEQVFSLYNAAGSLVWKAKLPAGRNQLPVNKFSKGVYILATDEVKTRVIIR